MIGKMSHGFNIELLKICLTVLVQINLYFLRLIVLPRTLNIV